MVDSPARSLPTAGVTTQLTRWVRLVGLGVGFGVLAGASLFIHLVPDVLVGFPPWIGVGLLFAVGGFVQIVVRDLERGVGVSLLALITAIATTALSYASPLLVLPYSEGAAQLLLTLFLGRTAAAIFIVLPLTFYGGYLLVLVVDAYLVRT